MSAKLVLGSLVVLGCVLSTTITTALFVDTLAVTGLGSVTAAAVAGSAALTFTASGATAGSTIYIAPVAAAAIGGVLLLKGAALATLVATAGQTASGRRRRRSTRSSNLEIDLMISQILKTETDQCYHRLVCDLATGVLPPSEGDVILALFDTVVPQESPRYDLFLAATIGKEFKSLRTCENRFSCPLNSAQFNTILA